MRFSTSSYTTNNAKQKLYLYALLQNTIYDWHKISDIEIKYPLTLIQALHAKSFTSELSA